LRVTSLSEGYELSNDHFGFDSSVVREEEVFETRGAGSVFLPHHVLSLGVVVIKVPVILGVDVEFGVRVLNDSEGVVDLRADAQIDRAGSCGSLQAENGIIDRLGEL
jgi:hypothetical protein